MCKECTDAGETICFVVVAKGRTACENCRNKHVACSLSPPKDPDSEGVPVRAPKAKRKAKAAPAEVPKPPKDEVPSRLSAKRSRIVLDSSGGEEASTGPSRSVSTHTRSLRSSSRRRQVSPGPLRERLGVVHTRLTSISSALSRRDNLRIQLAEVDEEVSRLVQEALDMASGAHQQAIEKNL